MASYIARRKFLALLGGAAAGPLSARAQQPAMPVVGLVTSRAADLGVAGLKHTKLAKVFNKAVVCQARKFVWATDDSQLEFVRRHIGTAPDRTIITEAQKQEALAAARGEHAVENPA